LREAGVDVTQPTAWSVKGLMPEAQDRLFDNITALSAPGSRRATSRAIDFVKPANDGGLRYSA
jgi:O-methyltransferase involved in polyketide biosynthesis